VVYGAEEHITERNPTRIYRMHLPPRILQQLNAARGRLRTIAHKDLFARIAFVFKQSQAPCCERTVFEFLRELQRIYVWPFEECMKRSSIDDLIDRLADFAEKNMRKYVDPKTDTPVDCVCYAADWITIIEHVATRVLGYFNGLCLDCMNKTKNLRPGGDQDTDYWEYMDHRDRWDLGCRITHAEPTWYFSFMGRREKKGLIADH
ncbi:uncharacterized protein BO97DRAFT_340628, partial [Aspergillus homomorphus CBS 101889]